MSQSLRRLTVVLLAVGLMHCAAPSSSPVSPVSPSAVVVTPPSVPLAAPRSVQPDDVLVDQFSGQLDRAIRKAFHGTGSGLRAASLAGDLVVVPIGTRAAGTYTFPDPAGTQVVIPSDITQATFTINIALADKLAVGKKLSARFYFSNDTWQTVIASTGGAWISYGPAGFFSAYLNQWNPDPSITVPIVNNSINYRGYLIRGVIVLDQTIDVGVTITTQ